MQGLFEVMGIPYTGSGVLASAIGMDKITCKRVWQTLGLPTPEWCGVAPGETVGAAFTLPAKLPLVVKPAAEGSSVGVSIVRERPKLVPAITKARAFGGDVLLERYVAGKEITVAILGTRALGAMEVVAEGEFHSYDVKYTPGKEQFLMPAPLSKKTYDRVLELRSRGPSRDRRGRILAGGSASRRPGASVPDRDQHAPGSDESFYLPKIAAHGGLTYPDLVEAILDSATLKLWRRRTREENRRRRAPHARRSALRRAGACCRRPRRAPPGSSPALRGTTGCEPPLFRGAQIDVEIARPSRRADESSPGPGSPRA